MREPQSGNARDDLLRQAQRLSDDEFLERRPDHRAALLRRAAFMTPAAIVATALLFYSAQYLPQSLLPLILLALCAVAIDIEAIATLRDLGAKPVVTRGRIDRLWKKSRYLFLGRVDYMLVGRTLFEINAISATELRLGEAVVVEHYPHTAMVISLARDRSEQPAE
jgi:hypothetical protein